ncbi:hypothetical protein AMECASPLE_025077 [Ameca splendens]|uniref:Uncharacterized protein n=1 Tax=Ameca splendens TaxID=208324 RepID=A0ABV0XTZ0_9TELE
MFSGKDGNLENMKKLQAPGEAIRGGKKKKKRILTGQNKNHRNRNDVWFCWEKIVLCSVKVTYNFVWRQQKTSLGVLPESSTLQQVSILDIHWEIIKSFIHIYSPFMHKEAIIQT